MRLDIPMSSINNADVFDEEELLAIANDSDDDSSGGSSRISSSSAAAASPHVEARVRTPSLPLRALEEDAADKINERHIQSQHESIAKHMSDASSSDDDDDDDGFLESWFDAENAKKRYAVPAEAAESQVEEFEEEIHNEVPTTNTDNEKATKDVKQDGGEAKNNIDTPNERRTELQLGTSVLNWISVRGRKTKKYSLSKMHESDGSNVGLVAIERNHEDNNPQGSAILRLSTSNTRKRRSVGSSDSITATLEEDASSNKGSADKPKRYIGQASFPNETDGAMSTSDGAMVNCLAVYNRQSRCYVLEIVDVMVTNLATSSEEVATSTRNERKADGAKLAIKSPSQHGELNCKATAGILIDPRSSSKRADNQIKLLKRKRQK